MTEAFPAARGGPQETVDHPSVFFAHLRMSAVLNEMFLIFPNFSKFCAAVT